MKVEGSVRLQSSARSLSIFGTDANSVPPMELLYYFIPLVPAAKVLSGTTAFPFTFELIGIDNQPLYETYHGVYVSVKYEIICDCVRGLMKRTLHSSVELIVECPATESMQDAPKTFEISPSTVQTVQRSKASVVPHFHISGCMHRTNCPVNLPFTGEFAIEKAEVPVKSVELQLIRVETVVHQGRAARDATEIQNIQIGWGDVCPELLIPIYMIFPRLFTCPTMITSGFKVEFEVNLVVLFENGDMVTENFPLALYR